MEKPYASSLSRSKVWSIVLKAFERSIRMTAIIVILYPKYCQGYGKDVCQWNQRLVKDYHNLYLKCDVLLLADTFEKFRNNSLNNH